MSLRKSLDYSSVAALNDADLTYTEFSAMLDNGAADDELVSFYKRTDNAIRKQLVIALNERQEKLLRKHYLNELNTAVTKLETEGHYSSGDARALYEEIKANKLSREETFHALHTSIDLLTTPVESEHMPHRAGKFFECMNEIRDKGKSNFRWGIGYAILAGLLIAGAVTVCVLSFGHITPHITPGMAVAVSVMESIQSINNGYKSYSIFKTASNQKAMANKMETLGNTLVPLQPPAPESPSSPRLT